MTNRFTRSFVFIFAFASALFLARQTPVRASDCVMDEYNHNGSMMEIFFCDTGVNIAYDRPRTALHKIGVKAGTILFVGSAAQNGLISGEAKSYTRGCKPLAFPVSGRLKDDRLVLAGHAPVRRRNCEIKRYRKDTLVFDPIGN